MEWQRLTDRAPWRSLSHSDWVDHLPPLLRAILDAAVCSAGSREGRRQVIEAATMHGEHRRSQELPLEVLLDEHSALRTAVWKFLSRRLTRISASDSLEEIIRFDSASTFAAMGSLRGYHRIEIERTRNWAGEIDQIVSDWERISVAARDQDAIQQIPAPES